MEPPSYHAPQARGMIEVANNFLQLLRYLHQEDFLFPVLNRTMNFSEEKDAHDVVHNKLDGLEVMLHEVEIDPKKFNPDRIREQLLALKEPLVSLQS